MHNNSDVALELEIQFRTLGSRKRKWHSRHFQSRVQGGNLLKEGEPAVVAGMITKSDQRSLNGLPLFSSIPGFGVLTSQNSKQEEDDELLILITPYVVRSPERSRSAGNLDGQIESGHRVIG